jgi:photosystem II stability/assembly factor-like uncharacterized protein
MATAPTWVATPTPTLTPAPTPTPGAGFPARPGMFSGANGLAVHLASDIVGWVSTTSALYRTGDDGKTWTEVRPPGWSEGATAQVIDADTMYFVSNSNGAKGRLAITATHDGGTSWVTATIDDSPAAGYDPLLSFRSPTSGSVVLYSYPVTKLRLYTTADGGRTWTGPVHPAVPASMHEAPNPGTASGALWLNNGRYDNKPFDERLVLSFDGGLTWKERAFPVSAAAPRGTQKGVDGMWTDGHGRIVIVIGNPDGDQIFTSGDGGWSWRFVKGWRQWPTVFTVQLISASEWILSATDGSQVRSTMDGGAHWRTTAGSRSIELDATSFASPDHAWAVHMCVYGGRGPLVPSPDPLCDGKGLNSLLLATTDGGRTWTPIGG